MRSLTVAAIAVVLGLHAGLWVALRSEASAPDVRTPLQSLSYAPFEANTGAENGDVAHAERIRSDLEKLAPSTRAVRTYSSTAGAERVAGIASEFGLKASIGAWIDKNTDRNTREIGSVIGLANQHPNVQSVFVGNETIFRGEQTVEELVKLIGNVKRAVSVPVTTGEIWNVWLEHPELASAADYIAAHVLPYWEGITAEKAADQAVIIYNKLRDAYPGKRIVIAEFGWPSAGHNLKSAVPGRRKQAEVLRRFVASADAYGIDYNIIEAIDQPWKSFEGSVGPYWGVFDTNREPKMSWAGPILAHDYWKHAGLALLLGLLLSIPILTHSATTLMQAACMAIAANGVGAWAAAVAAYWFEHYFVPGAAFAYAAGVLLLVPLALFVLVRIEEFAAIVFGRMPQRLIADEARQFASRQRRPMVSIHVPAHCEPPHMLIATLESVAALDYPDFECIVVVNNTPDPALWRPVKTRCRQLGRRFKFVRVEGLEGFKAGALRQALNQTSPRAQIIGVLDADYVVGPDWLSTLVPYFGDARVGLVQAPQDHRDGARSPVHAAMNSEYAGFFDIGMVQRNEVNALIVHGTMCLIRRQALEEAGSWSSDTICEDSDLGLTLLEQGWQIHYTHTRFGHGLLPDTLEAFRKQRHRWAYGGVQIIKKHWRQFVPGASNLTHDQRREFALGWAGWLGAESVGVAVALFNLVMLPFILFFDAAVPNAILTVPIVASFAVALVHFTVLYRLRSRRSMKDMAGALVAAMSVQRTIARAVICGLVRNRLPFIVTAKGGAEKCNACRIVTGEAAVGGLLAAGAAALYGSNINDVKAYNLFAGVLALQSLPFLAATGLRLLEASRLNDYTFWERVRVRYIHPATSKALAITRAANAKIAAPIVRTWQ